MIASSDFDVLLCHLAATPGRIGAVSRGLDDAQLGRPPSEGAWSANEILAHLRAWSANEILAHLRACADVWGGSIQAMIARDHPTIRYVSPRTWIRKTTYTSQPFSASLAELAAQRDDLLRTLRSLDPADWARGATFSGTTRGREQTILDYVRRLVAHELEHCEQMEAALTRP